MREREKDQGERDILDELLCMLSKRKEGREGGIYLCIIYLEMEGGGREGGLRANLELQLDGRTNNILL